MRSTAWSARLANASTVVLVALAIVAVGACGRFGYVRNETMDGGPDALDAVATGEHD